MSLQNQIQTTQFDPNTGAIIPGTTPSLYDMGDSATSAQNTGNLSGADAGASGMSDNSLAIAQAGVSAANEVFVPDRHKFSKYGEKPRESGYQAGMSSAQELLPLVAASGFNPVVAGLAIAKVGHDWWKTGKENKELGIAETQAKHDDYRIRSQQSDNFQQNMTPYALVENGGDPKMTKDGYSIPYTNYYDKNTNAPIGLFEMGGGRDMVRLEGGHNIGDKNSYSLSDGSHVVTKENIPRVKQAIYDKTGMRTEGVDVLSAEHGAGNALVNSGEMVVNKTRPIANANIDLWSQGSPDSDYIPQSLENGGVKMENAGGYDPNALYNAMLMSNYGSHNTRPAYQRDEEWQKKSAQNQLAINIAEAAANKTMLEHNKRQKPMKVEAPSPIAPPRTTVDIRKAFTDPAKEGLKEQASATRSALTKSGMTDRLLTHQHQTAEQLSDIEAKGIQHEVQQDAMQKEADYKAAVTNQEVQLKTDMANAQLAGEAARQEMVANAQIQKNLWDIAHESGELVTTQQYFKEQDRMGSAKLALEDAESKGYIAADQYKDFSGMSSREIMRGLKKIGYSA